jgi:radical SAM superfamily enzyme YgiQ (UPF0313 family)
MERKERFGETDHSLLRPAISRREIPARAKARDIILAMNAGFPIRYVDPVFRPPSEAESLILPVTDGCSWNKCAFCEMYTAPQKKFRARDEEETLATLRRCGERFGRDIRRVFLADGDALVLPTRRLLDILAAIREHLPAVRRVSSYCLPRNLRKKSVGELQELAAAGLTMAYVGAESGDDEVLAKVKQGRELSPAPATPWTKLQQAGIKRSVMILNGLGGKTLSAQHAANSARLANATQPEYLAVLVVNFPQGEARFRAAFPEWQPCDDRELFLRNGSLHLGAGTAAHSIPQRPRLQPAGAERHAWRRETAPAR